MEFSGRLAAFPPAELLQWAHNDCQTGALVVRRSKREKRVYFRDGRVVLCYSDDPAEHYGQHLLSNGYLDEPSLIRLLNRCTQENKRLGAMLQETGLLAPETVRKSLRQHIQDLICDLFLWRHGVFFFDAEEPAQDDLLIEPIDPLALALEGARWADEYRRIRQVLVHDNILLHRGPSPPDGKLSPLEQRLLLMVDGRKTLRELYQAVRGSYFRFLQTAFQLHENRSLALGQVGEAHKTTTTEISVFDLLLEQATEEEVLFLKRGRVVSVAVLEGLYPLWLGDPAGEDDLAFCRRFDGSRSLGELLSGDDARRAKEIEAVLAALRSKRLALLPAPLEQMPPPGWWRKLLVDV